MYETMNGSAHPLAPPEIAVTAMPEDERIWVPQAPDVWFRPLMLSTLQGQWCNLLRVRRGTGAVVNLASMLSYFGGGLVPGYAASKGGIAQLTKSLAIAYADDGIRVNAIAPGGIATPLTTELRQDAQRSQAILGRTPLKRWGTPDDLVGGVVYLCSPAASFVTGTTHNIDGGYAIA